MSRRAAGAFLICALAMWPQAAKTQPEPLNRAMNAELAELDVWRSCTLGFVARFAGTHEPATVVAKAAFAYCQQAENTAYLAIIKAGDPTKRHDRWQEFVDAEIWPTVKRTLEQQTIAAVLVSRSKR